jgi:outer membrane protein OmpA-like peptidoglycan-associated protein
MARPFLILTVLSIALHAPDKTGFQNNARQTCGHAEVQSKTQAWPGTAEAKLDMDRNQLTATIAMNAAQAEVEQVRSDARLARQKARAANKSKAAIRARLSEQLQASIGSQSSAHSLIVNMSDVLFDRASDRLTGEARQKLAMVADILLAYPGLNIEARGYGDNVGGNTFNQLLSIRRAESVRSYLLQQGVAKHSVQTRGFGNAAPLESTDSASGGQRNRRVEFVVSDDGIRPQ